AAFGDDLDVGVRREHGAHTASRQRLIVDDQGSDHAGSSQGINKVVGMDVMFEQTSIRASLPSRLQRTSIEPPLPSVRSSTTFSITGCSDSAGTRQARTSSLAM